MSVTLRGAAAEHASSQTDLATFVTALQQATARNDRRAVSGMMRYPLEVHAEGFRLPVPNAQAFLDLYEQIFSAGTKAVVARARMPESGKPSSTVAIDSKGTAVIEGAIVIEPVGGVPRITRMTVASAAPSAGGAASTASRRLSFRVGRPTEVNGALAPGGVDRYSVSATEGTLLDVRLNGVKGNTVLVRIVDQKTGQPIDARAGAGTRVWTGRVPAASEYRIEVARQPDSGAGTLLYVLAVSLK